MVKMEDSDMKKFFGIFAAVFALTAIVFSCQKAEMDEPQTEQTYDKVETVLTAVLEPRTKVALAFPNLSWEDQDQIAVFDGVDPKPNVFTCSIPAAEEGDEAVETEPTFSGSISGQAAATLYAVYPYNENASLSEGKITTTIPHEQVIPEGGNVDKSALLCVASTSTNELNFRNVLGLVKVTVPSGMTGITSISVKGADEADVLAGTGAVAVSDAPSFVATDAKNMVTLTHAKGGFPKGDYYIAVAPVKFANGFSVSFTKANGETQTKSTENANEVLRNSGLNVGDQLTDITWSYIITTKEQLVEWNNNYKSWTKNDIVELGADIDLDGVDWTPHDFSGRFNGDNHKIYNISISRDGYCGFVAALNGTIQNLYLGTSDGEAYDGKSEYVYTPDATAGSWVHMGGVAASINNGALIKNVTNFVKISTPDSDGQAKVCMGGLVSMGTGTSEIQDCVNYGEIVCDASVGVVSGASNHQIGGIMCKTDGTVTITNCKNYGNISAKGAYVDNVGGIMANPNGNATDKGENKTHIKGCYNYGNITITKTTSAVTPMALGGIVGKLTGATVEDCHNEGNINSVCDVLTGIGGVVGIHKLDYESKITGCSNGVLNATDKGILSFNPEEGTQQMVIGGVLGYSEHGAAGKLTIQSSNNYAPIDVSYGKFRNIGGICGVVGDFTSSRDGKKSSVELLIDDCHNHGAITVTSATSYTTADAAWQKHIGGVVGILYGSDKGVKISNSSNEATLYSTATGNGETRIAGIVAHTRYGNIEVSTCTNNGEVKTTDKATNARPAGIISVTNAATKLDVKQCYNKKTISSSATVGTFFAGGIVAYLLGPATISECYNQGEVTISAAGGLCKIGGIAGQAEGVTIKQSHNQMKISSTVSNQKPLIGGIVGNITKNVTISNCHNEEKGVIECTKAGNTVCMGGLVGRYGDAVAQGIKINNSSNSCAINALVTNKHLIIGGLVGVIEGGNATGVQNEITSCTNNGKITVTPAGTNYARVGGVAGYIANASNVVVNSCTNDAGGEIYVNGTTTNYVYAGGIVGHSNANVGYSGNTNKAKIGGSSAGNYYVGGIWGLDAALGSGHTAKDITGNKNYGELYGTTAEGKTHSVGGLFGAVASVAAANLKSDNTDYGNVTCAGGALAGTSKVTWSGLVGKTVTVNGTAGAAAAPEASWVCPSGNVTATYVEAIQ